MAKVTKLTLAERPVSGTGEWLRFPDAITALAPEDRNQVCAYKIGRDDTLKAARAGRRQPAFQLWSVVLGHPPPVPGVEYRNRPEPNELTSLVEAHACFRGIERPLAEDDEGSNVVAYVLRPKVFYEYTADMVCTATKVTVPPGFVFVAYAKLVEPDGVPRAVRGVLTHWGFVEADEATPELPVNYATRYRVRLW